MKKTILRLIKLKIIILSATALINHMIFYFAKRRRVFENKFRWRHGDINYSRVGEGEPVLLIHGIYPGASRKEWERCADILSQHYRVYSIDLLGFGESDKPQISYSAYLYVTLINDFVKKVIREKTRVIATGDSAAFTVMAQVFEPDSFEKMVLISPEGLDVKYPRHINVWQRWLLESPIIGTAIYNVLASKTSLRRMLKGFGDNAISDNLSELYLSSHSAIGAKMPISANISKHMAVDIKAKLDTINIPVHIVWGMGFEQDNKEYMPHFSDPDIFCKNCIEFLEK